MAGDLQFKVDSEWQTFWETFHDNFPFTLRVFARNLLRRNRHRNTFRISFWCPALDFSSNKPTHYLLDHSDFGLNNHLLLWKNFELKLNKENKKKNMEIWLLKIPYPLTEGIVSAVPNINNKNCFNCIFYWISLL